MSYRKPILQLSRPISAQQQQGLARVAQQPPSAGRISDEQPRRGGDVQAANPLQQLLGAYSDSDSDEDAEEARNDGPTDELDAELASFMKEINAMPVVDDPAAVSAEPSDAVATAENANVGNDTVLQANPESPAAGHGATSAAEADAFPKPELDSPFHAHSRTLLARLDHILAAAYGTASLRPRVAVLSEKRAALAFRISEWNEGAYRAGYFEKTCGVLEGYLRVLEGQVAPVGWVYTWSEEDQSYYFRHGLTGAVSWNEPTPQCTAQLESISATAQPRSNETPPPPPPLSELSPPPPPPAETEIDPDNLPPPPPPPPREPSPTSNLGPDLSGNNDNSAHGTANGHGNGPSRKRKVDAAHTGGIKSKKMLSLVQKWQTMEGSSDEDDDPVAQWGKTQMESGRASAEDNANFTPLSGDWRERRLGQG